MAVDTNWLLRTLMAVDTNGNGCRMDGEKEVDLKCPGSTPKETSGQLDHAGK